MKNGTQRLRELMEIYDFPLEAIQDVLYRLGWHFLSGGQVGDDYVWKQVRFFENLVKFGNVTRKEKVK